MILLIDNYDSFSYNLVQLTGAIRPDIKVVRNDNITINEIERLQPQAIILSPGPGRPENAGICVETVRKLGSCIPILGVCLGHQAICQAYGAQISYAKQLLHGKSSRIIFDPDSQLFAGINAGVTVGRYHSLAAVKETMPSEIKVTAVTTDGEIMAIEHEVDPVFGVQFHPESILTPKGEAIIQNFLSVSDRRSPR